MNELVWTECNLPWKTKQVYYEVRPPNLDEKAILELGFSIDEEEVSFKTLADKVGDRYFEICDETDKRYTEWESTQENLDDDVAIEMERQIKAAVSRELLGEEYVVRSARLKELREKRYDWLEVQPEFLAWKKTSDDFNQEQRKKSFRHMAKPGLLIELQCGKQLLIGHLNTSGGVCDDCSGIEDEDIIVRYSVIWECK